MIVRTAEELNISDTNELVMQMEKLKIKYLLYIIKHDAYNEVVKMVDILFDKMNIKGKAVRRRHEVRRLHRRET